MTETSSSAPVQRLKDLMTGNQMCSSRLHVKVPVNVPGVVIRQSSKDMVVVVLRIIVLACALLTLAAVAWCIVRETRYRRRDYVVQRSLFH